MQLLSSPLDVTIRHNPKTSQDYLPNFIPLWERKPWISSDPQRCFCFPQIWNLRSRYFKDYPSNGLDQGLANSGLWTKSGLLPVSVNKIFLDYSHLCTYCLWLLSHYNVRWVVGIEISGPAKPKIFTICTLIKKKIANPRVNQKFGSLQHIVWASWLLFPGCVCGLVLWACTVEPCKRKPSFLLQRCCWGHSLLSFTEFLFMRTWRTSLSSVWVVIFMMMSMII